MNLKECKNNNEQYLKAMQKFFDLADNIQDEQLKKSIIYQMLECDKLLTQIAGMNAETEES